MVNGKTPHVPSTYQSNPKHRNTTAGASQWTISLIDEEKSFRLSERSGWLQIGIGWGIHVVGNAAANLGVAYGEDAFIAIFRSGVAPVQWHGYPEQSQWARVPNAIAYAWFSRGLIRLRTVRQIVKGQPCGL